MRDLRSASVDELVVGYAQAAGTQGKAAVAGDHRKANRRADEIATIYRELRDRGRDAQMALMPLLQHPDADVRTWAAAHALEFAPADGERVLEELALDEGMLGFRAQMTLREWHEGTLRFP